jgi:hypothetical protein
LSGHPLTGHYLVRNIYSDEAGISAKEPVSVVVSLIVHTDTQWKPVVGKMVQLVQQYVPQEYWPTFALHTKTLVRQQTYPNWDRPRRYAFLREVMRIPRQAGIPICVGAVRRGAQPRANVDLTADKQDHALAFVLSMAQADKIIRNRCGIEMAQVIAEDHPEMKRLLRSAVNVLRFQPLTLPNTSFSSNIPKSQPEPYRVERIVDEVHFMDRHGSPFLQIADACAFGLRRYYSDLTYGDSYMDEILGSGKVQPPHGKAKWASHHVAYFNVLPDGRLFNPFDLSQLSAIYTPPKQEENSDPKPRSV